MKHPVMSTNLVANETSLPRSPPHSEKIQQSLSFHAFFTAPPPPPSSFCSFEAIIALLCTDIIRQQRLTEALALAVIRCERTPTFHFKLCRRIFSLIYSSPARLRRGCGGNNKTKNLQTRHRGRKKTTKKTSIYEATSNFQLDPLTRPPSTHTHTHTIPSDNREVIL